MLMMESEEELKQMQKYSLKFEHINRLLLVIM